jgi:hypothetical protein
MRDSQTSRIIEEFSWSTVRDEWATLSAMIRDCKLRKHPLGFVHGEVISGEDAAVRLHIWDSTERTVQEPRWMIHTHIFELKSIVLVGSLSNRMYGWTDGGPHPNAKLYQITYNGNHSCLEATAREGICEQISSLDVCRSELYTVKCGEFHNTFVPEQAYTATLALTIKRPGTPLVVGEKVGKPSYSYTRCEVSSDVQSRLVDDLMRRVSI